MRKVFCLSLSKLFLVTVLQFVSVSSAIVMADDHQQQSVISNKKAAQIAQSQVAGKVLKVSLRNGIYQVKILQGDKVKHVRINAYSGAIL